ncbi:MAG TPA: hypothetical protein VFO30_09005 [Chthoniobacterales bacterium]|nr:hypothetical protein [Chthoniobacterales bacterium]
MTKLSFATAAIAVICSVSLSRGQESPAATGSPAASAPAPRPEVYHVIFVHAATGKASALEDAMKKAAASGPMPGHNLGLRHEAGAPWDYVGIQHLGTKATVEATGNPQGATMRPLMDWHDDTFVNGPAWPDFAKAMGLDESGKPKSNEDVYVVSVYRPIPGQDDALDKFLAEPPSASGDLAVGTVVLQHLEGGAWRFLSISHYKNFQDYAASEVKSVAETAKGTGGWYRLRELCSFHNDTITVHTKP